MRSAKFPLGFALLTSLLAVAQSQVTSPKEFFGFDMGEDYHLANYKRMAEYWQLLDRQSDRLRLVSIGKTEEGRDQYMMIASTPDNLRRMETYRSISQRLGLAKGVDESQARSLAHEGKAVVWLDGGLHATEVLCAQALIEMSYRLATASDDETLRILRDCFVLMVHANPDGHDLVADWYMRREDPRTRSIAGLPRLYQKYIGHDNNRDFYAATQKETQNMNRVLYREWFPQIVYNHHQTGPAGTVMFAPPFRDPYPYELDPLVRTTLEGVAASMHRRFAAENKPGVTQRRGANYSAWWNGGLRTTTYFHNMIGILTETIGSPNPIRIPFVANRQLPSENLPFPIEPQEWRLRQSVEYSITANYAILDYASRHREQLLFNFWRMGMNSIERGSRDTWTPSPRRIQSARSFEDLRRPEDRDPWAYIIPAEQRDPAGAMRFANALLSCGIEIRQASRPFQVAGKTYPARSLIVRCDQAFRPHILSMFEPQDHPDDFPYPGGPPIAPYDSAGWTLAFTMGVEFDRVFEPVEAQHEALVEPVRIRLVYSGRAPRIALWDRYGGSMESGWTRWILEQYGLRFDVVYPPDIDKGGLRDKYDVLILPSGATIGGGRGGQEPPSGEGFAPEHDWPNEEREGMHLAVTEQGGGLAGLQNDPTIPAEWRARMGSLSAERSLPAIRDFLEAGGVVLAIGSATRLAGQLGLPIGDALTEKVDGGERRLPREKFYIPASVLRMRVDNAHALAAGMPEYVDTIFDNSPTFKLLDGADAAGIKRIAWFDTDKPLRSGWAWGQEHLKEAVAAFEAPVGKGRLYAFGPEILFRAQTQASFGFLLNAIRNAAP